MRIQGHATFKTLMDPGTAPPPVQFGMCPLTPPTCSSLVHERNFHSAISSTLNFASDAFGDTGVRCFIDESLSATKSNPGMFTTRPSSRRARPSNSTTMNSPGTMQPSPHTTLCFPFLVGDSVLTKKNSEVGEEPRGLGNENDRIVSGMSCIYCFCIVALASNVAFQWLLDNMIPRNGLGTAVIVGRGAIYTLFSVLTTGETGTSAYRHWWRAWTPTQTHCPLF